MKATSVGEKALFPESLVWNSLGGKVSETGVRSNCIVVLAPVLDHDLGLGLTGEPLYDQHSSRNLSLKDSLLTFCQGLPGSMWAILMPVAVMLSEEKRNDVRSLMRCPICSRGRQVYAPPTGHVADYVLGVLMAPIKQKSVV
jgi:hypothetical protein